MALQVTEPIVLKGKIMERINMMSGIIAALLGIIALVAVLSGCAGMSESEQRAASGALIGAGAGGIIGAIAGNAGLGAAAGAGLGGTGGFLYGRHNEAVKRAYEQGRADAGARR
jgi:osmotically inducible lipoprotein OsmB